MDKLNEDRDKPLVSINTEETASQPELLSSSADDEVIQEDEPFVSPEENPNSEVKSNTGESTLLTDNIASNSIESVIQPNESSLSEIKYPLNKILVIVGGLFILILAIVYYVHYRHQIELYNQTATQVINQMGHYQDVKTYLQLPLTLDGKVTGKVASDGTAAVITFPVKGGETRAHVATSMQNGTIITLNLRLANGQNYNVLTDQRAYETQQALEQAKKAQQAAIVATYQNALSALQTKNYMVAITGFLQSLTNHYNIVRSTEYLGFSYSQTGDFGNCIVYYNQYIKLQGEDPEAYYQMAYCQLELYQKEAALANLDKACDLGNEMGCAAASQIRGTTTQPKSVDSTLTNPESASAPEASGP